MRQPDPRRSRPGRGGGSKVDAGQVEDRPQRIHRRTAEPEHLGPTLLDALDDLEHGRRLRDDGTKAAEHGSHPAWRVAALRAIDECAALRVEFDVEDVRARCGDPLGSHVNAMGALLAGAVRRGIIKPVGYGQATRPVAHARVIRTFVGVDNGGG